MKKKYIIISLVILMVFVSAISVGVVKANSLYFSKTTQTSTATTSPKFIPSGGTATSSLAFDTYDANGNTQLTDSMVLFIEQSATNTTLAANLNIYIQYAQGSTGTGAGTDCTANLASSCDWFEDGGTMGFNYASTSKPFDITTVNKYTLAFASTSPDLRALTQATTTYRMLRINVPTRYVRAVITSSPGAPSQAYWAQWIPAKQKP